MKHLAFPTKAQADEFIQDLQSQGVIQKGLGTTDLSRSTVTNPNSSNMNSSSTLSDPMLEGGTAEDAGLGAVRCTGAGVVAGAVAGVVATIATGGLADIPTILGMTALGAAVGAAGGAMGVDETATDSSLKSDSALIGSTGAGLSGAGSSLTDDQYNRLNTHVSSGGYPVAVDDSVPADIVASAVTRHGGEFV